MVIGIQRLDSTNLNHATTFFDADLRRLMLKKMYKMDTENYCLMHYRKN